MKHLIFSALMFGTITLAVAQTAVPPFPGIRLQGTLTDNAGNLVAGSHNVTVRIFKHPTTGVPIYTEVYNSMVFTNGILDVLVGATALPYDSLYYIETQLDNEVFSPRTQLASTPYALHAFRSDTATYANSAIPVGAAGGALSGTYPNPSLADSSIQFNKIAQNGAISGQVMKWSGTTWMPANDSSISGVFLPLAGGVMTGAITNIGNPPITMGKGNFGDNNVNIGANSFVAGSNNRAVGNYSTVSGGGGPTAADSNYVDGEYATISGGKANRIKGSLSRPYTGYSSIGGGLDNSIIGSIGVISGGVDGKIEGDGSVIGGGQGNIVQGFVSTIGGGGINRIGSNNATIGGGTFNYAGGANATVAGGYNNRAYGIGSFIGGGGTETIVDSNVSIGDYSVVVGGWNNTAKGTSSTISGGDSNFIELYSFNASISGGHGNSISGQKSAIGGGSNNYIFAGPGLCTIGGGLSNAVYSERGTVGGGSKNFVGVNIGGPMNGVASTIGGGENNRVIGNGATVGGGSGNVAGEIANGTITPDGIWDISKGAGRNPSEILNPSAVGNGSTIAGGTGNSTHRNGSTIGGGGNNRAWGQGSTISGGSDNTAGRMVNSDVPGNSSTVGGGSANDNWADYATISGGQNNVVGRYSGGIFGGKSSVIGGGSGNSITGDYSTIPGGSQNSIAGNFAFAAGQRAKALHGGVFVWADSSNADFASDTVNQFTVRATGGTKIYSSADLSAGVTLAPGASAWSSVSDSTMKRNARVVDGAEILDKLDKLPIKQWSYKAQDPSIEHVGPMAQDFYSLFGLGENNKTISTIDPSGIALAAIQQLHKENAELKKRLAELESLVKSLGGTK